MASPAVGVSIQALSAREFVEQVQRAEQAGIPVAWSTVGGAGGADVPTTMAAAITATRTIRLGTAIVPTWPRHAITMAQQALALEQLGPGRFRLGIGPSHEPAMVRGYGVRWETPLTQLREYLTAIRSLFATGAVDFEGRHVTARTQWRGPAAVDLLASALRPKSFELCGALADGAISWMCPRAYLITEALPAIARGAARARREPPPLIAHVPVAVNTDRPAVRALARQHLGNYAQIPFYAAMFRDAGFPDVAGGYSDALLDDLVVSGTEDQVVERLAGYVRAGCREVLAAPLIERDDHEGSIARAFRAIALAHRTVAS